MGFGCYGDALGRAVGLDTATKILLDGANGVSQAARQCATLEPPLLLIALVTLVAVGAVRTAGWRSVRGRTVALAILGVSYVPGWFHVLAIRADRPSAQRTLTQEIASTRAAYVSAMQTALAPVPPGTCFVPNYVGSCVDPSGIYLGAARDLWPRFRCIGGEAHTITVEISDCSPVDVRARVVR